MLIFKRKQTVMSLDSEWYRGVSLKLHPLRHRALKRKTFARFGLSYSI